MLWNTRYGCLKCIKLFRLCWASKFATILDSTFYLWLFDQKSIYFPFKFAALSTALWKKPMRFKLEPLSNLFFVTNFWILKKNPIKSTFLVKIVKCNLSNFIIFFKNFSKPNLTLFSKFWEYEKRKKKNIEILTILATRNFRGKICEIKRSRK